MKRWSEQTLKPEGFVGGFVGGTNGGLGRTQRIFFSSCSISNNEEEE
jgi:hypothetical protein